MTDEKNIYIVGLGASAGGFEALQKFLEKIEENEKILYVIVQHLDPNQPTLLGNLLSKYTKIPIAMIENEMIPLPNNIYFCPPNKDLTLKNNRFILTEPQEKAYPKPSINKFFESLAIEKKEKAIGVILSGTGSDGAKGIELIHKFGGIALAEDEGAKYFSMPKAAIDTGVVDSVLPPELLCESIPLVIEDREYFTKQYEVKGSVYKIFDLLNKKIGIDFSSYKENTIFRRIKKRMSETKKIEIEDYIEFLKTDSDELEKLKNELLIIVTSFFRGEEAFLELETNLETLIRSKDEHILRVWVTACATGEEAYTVAIIIKEILKRLDIDKKVTIFATDVSEIAIEGARNKSYSVEQMAGVKSEFVTKYFDEHSTGFRPKKVIRDMIIFSKHDIIKDPPFSNLDLISCRNLLIYFNNDLQKNIMGAFYYALKFGGLLFLGQSETIGTLGHLFSTVHSKNKLYKKTSDIGILPPEGLRFGKKSTFISNNERNIQEKNNIVEIDFSINKAVSKEFGKNGLVIDGNSNHILFYKGDTTEFISQPKGINTNDIFKLAKDYLKLDLRATLNEAKNKKSFVSSKKIKILPYNELNFYLLILIFPLDSNKLGDNTFFIIFDKFEEKNVLKIGDKFESSNSNELSILEDELASLKERLQITIEELETSNEELQSTNEELQSTNEELQSTNEELETSNEELQSTNEELQTVNDELSFKNSELEFAQKAFNNVLSSIKVDVLIVDKELNILKYTDGILKFFDISKLRSDNFSKILLNSTIALPNLLEDLRLCLQTDSEVGYEVTLGTKIFWFRVHKISMSAKKENDETGLVLSFLDKTEIFEKDKLLYQQSKMAAMGEMIGNIAHQWRQPLNVLGIQISLFIEKIANKKLNDEDITHFVHQYQTQLTSMSKTIDDFRDFFKPTGNYMETFLSDSILQAQTMTEESLKINQIELRYPKTDAKFIGSKSELAQVLLNIFSNSKEAFIQKEIKNRLIDLSITHNEKYLIIKILDNAGGVEPEYLSHLGEAYFSTKKSQNGTGIGMYMSKMIIEKMGGKLLFENKKKGLQVTIELPNIKE